MLRICIFSILVFALACRNSASDQEPAKEDTNTQSSKIKAPSDQENKILHKKIDTLSNEEKFFLKKLSKENESIILSNQVERYFSENDSIPKISKLIYNEDSLIKEGYVYMVLTFYGEISRVNVKYEYNRGQADIGFGSVAGYNEDNYLHVFEGCGLSSCITEVYRNGKRVFEKNNELEQYKDQ